MDSHISLPGIQCLKTTFTSAEYLRMAQQYSRNGLFRPHKAGVAYWQQLPEYLISRCPLCDKDYTAKLDTHSLLGQWATHATSWKHVYDEEHQHIGCDHFVAVQSFINLNGRIPNKLPYFHNDLDVPFVMPPFVPDNVPAYAVIHGLPICDIEHNAFVPRYSLFMITYYATTPATILARRRTENAIFRRGDPDAPTTMLFTAGEAYAHPEAGNLPLWVANRKLQWLDSTVAQLPLRVGPPEAFPYAHIRGYRRPFTIRYGKLQLGI